MDDVASHCGHAMNTARSTHAHTLRKPTRTTGRRRRGPRRTGTGNGATPVACLQPNRTHRHPRVVAPFLLCVPTTREAAANFAALNFESTESVTPPTGTPASRASCTCRCTNRAPGKPTRSLTNHCRSHSSSHKPVASSSMVQIRHRGS